MKYKPSIGSISHGTMRSEDLLPAFADELERLTKRRHGYQGTRHLIKAARKWVAGAAKHGDSLNYRELGTDLVFHLEDELNVLAPPYCYFGAHEGDGSDFGFWPIDRDDMIQSVRDGDGVVVDDLIKVPTRFTGEVLFINERGNTTLYHKTARKLTEVWSIV